MLRYKLGLLLSLMATAGIPYTWRVVSNTDITFRSTYPPIYYATGGTELTEADKLPFASYPLVSCNAVSSLTGKKILYKN